MSTTATTQTQPIDAVQVEVRRLVAEALKTLEFEPLFPLTYLQGELCNRVPLGMTLATFTDQVKDGMLSADPRLRYNDKFAAFWQVPTGDRVDIPTPVAPEPTVAVPAEQASAAAGNVLQEEVDKFTSYAIRWVTANGTPYHISDIVGKTKASPLPGVSTTAFVERIVKRMKQDARLKYSVDARGRRVFSLKKDHPIAAPSISPRPVDDLQGMEAMLEKIRQTFSSVSAEMARPSPADAADVLVKKLVKMYTSKILMQLQKQRFRNYWVDVISDQTRQQVVLPKDMTHDQLVNRIVQGVIAHKLLRLEVDHRGKLLISHVDRPYCIDVGSDGKKTPAAPLGISRKTAPSPAAAVAATARPTPPEPTPPATLLAPAPTNSTTINRIKTAFTREELAQVLEADDAFQNGIVAMHVVDIECDGVSVPRHVVVLATHSATYVVDCDSATDLAESLGPVLANPAVTKVCFDLYQDLVPLHKMCPDLHLQGIFDMQLHMERQTGDFNMGFRSFVKQLPTRAHSSQECVLAPKLFDQPFAMRHKVECAANDVALLLRGYTLTMDDKLAGWLPVQAASDARAISAIELRGQRELVYNKAGTKLALVSLELLAAIHAFDMHVLPEPTMFEDVAPLLSLVPTAAAGPLRAMAGTLTDIVLDKGQLPWAWNNGHRVELTDDMRTTVTSSDLVAIATKVGGFGSNNCKTLKDQLHRISATYNSDQELVGLSMRVGRRILGLSDLLLDVLATDANILFLGEPGSGKSTALRDVARFLSETRNVCIVDTTNELAGEMTSNITTHLMRMDLGGGDLSLLFGKAARGVKVPALDNRAAIMVDEVVNHTPEVLIVDDIGRSSDVNAARACKQRGVRLIASAHGSLRSLIQCKELQGLVGVEPLTMGSAYAAMLGKPMGKTELDRSDEPVVDVIVELQKGAFNAWRVVSDVAMAVDNILDGKTYKANVRSKKGNGLTSFAVML